MPVWYRIKGKVEIYISPDPPVPPKKNEDGKWAAERKNVKLGKHTDVGSLQSALR